MDPDEIGLLREELLRERQTLIHNRIRGRTTGAIREKYLSIRDRESLLVYEELKNENRTSTAARVFERPRSPEKKQNGRLRIWINLLMIAMVLAVVFFSVITPRLTSTHGEAAEDTEQGLIPRESLP